MCKYKTYNFRIFPDKQQISEIENLSKISTEIYNHFLHLNQEEYKTNKKMFGNFTMHKMLTTLKQEFKHWKTLNSKSSQAIINSLFSNYRSFFNLIKKDKTAKPPHFKDLTKFHTILFNQTGWR